MAAPKGELHPGVCGLGIPPNARAPCGGIPPGIGRPPCIKGMPPGGPGEHMPGCTSAIGPVSTSPLSHYTRHSFTNTHLPRSGHDARRAGATAGAHGRVHLQACNARVVRLLCCHARCHARRTRSDRAHHLPANRHWRARHALVLPGHLLLLLMRHWQLLLLLRTPRQRALVWRRWRLRSMPSNAWRRRRHHVTHGCGRTTRILPSPSARLQSWVVRGRM